MFLDRQHAPKLELMNAKEPDYVSASKLKRVLEKTSFEYISEHKKEIVTAALVWDTNSYFVDVESQVFVVNGGKKIQFEEWPINDAELFLVRRCKMDVQGNEKGDTEVLGYLLGLQGTADGAPRLILIHISPDGSAFRFKTSR